ncbi:hypothetical protein DUNSADRAFT_4103 [Dunaliella salina]|uniref:Encoded protein n=1 Tax=Dunaliella salina TaxID=3046 RepID=A0ABQ7FUZ7_DUNSA|nr:hypothetical protein DUNSADRAFT_4103 [Dunaliella salina]|eukprot:KAF5826218.1 hypothetical protein DUNSADRAFT_4103 [Dunaliella salina]
MPWALVAASHISDAQRVTAAASHWEILPGRTAFSTAAEASAASAAAATAGSGGIGAGTKSSNQSCPRPLGGGGADGGAGFGKDGGVCSSGGGGGGEGDMAVDEYEVVVPCPCLELWLPGNLMLSVSKSLLSGLLLVQPGPGVGNDAFLEVLGAWQQKEEAIRSEAAQEFARPGPKPATRALEVTCKHLAALCHEQQKVR